MIVNVFSRVHVDKLGDAAQEATVYIQREELEKRTATTVARVFVIDKAGNTWRAFISVWHRSSDDSVHVVLTTPMATKDVSHKVKPRRIPPDPAPGLTRPYWMAEAQKLGLEIEP